MVETGMTDLGNTVAASTTPKGDAGRPAAARMDLPQLLFWAALAVGLGAAGIAVTAGQAVGQAGAMLLILLLACGLVWFVYVSRGPGRRHGIFPQHGAIEASTLQAQRHDFLLIEALDEAALVTDRAQSPLIANAAYLQLAEAAGVLGDSDRPPMMSRVFGADPTLSAPMFRLSKAAGAMQNRREPLPPTRLSAEGEPMRFEASVGPMPGGKLLWRLRRMAAQGEQGVPEAQDLFLEDAPFGFLVTGPDGAIIYMNRALRAELGVGEDASRMRLKDIVREDPARIVRRDRRSFGASRTQITLRARDGMEKSAPAMTFWSADQNDAASRTVVFLAAEDQPGHKPQTAAAPMSLTTTAQAPAAALFAMEQAPVGVAVLDASDPAGAAILDANPALIEMTQGRAVPGAAFAHLFDASEGPNALAQRLRSAGAQALELQLATSPAIAAHLTIAQGANGGAVAYLINVSEQRELEQRLAQAEKMREIGMLAGGVAHDFNSRLMAVMQMCDWLLRRHPVGDPDYPVLKEMADSATVARELSGMLMAYSRQQTLKREVVDVSDFIAHTQELIRRMLGETISFDIVHGRDLPRVKVDKAQLERVLVNLATNARDAMTPKDAGIPRDGRLTVRTLCVNAEEARAHGHAPIEDGTYVLIEVEDTGIGIKPEDQAKIFRPFHSTKERGHGTGLGLATCYGIVKQSGGYIFFSSSYGKGTTFRIYLPTYEPSVEEEAELEERSRQALEPPKSTDVAGRGRILLVEDIQPLRRSTARNLEDCGFEVMEAENGEEALEILGENLGAFDIIISDVSMPLMGGPEMLRAATPEMLGAAKVLFLSGYAPESFSKLLEQYPVSYMSKPVGLPELAARVKELLAQ
jgi:two-component system cell cycle sensor histidine kinase/response regulator CckA